MRRFPGWMIVVFATAMVLVLLGGYLFQHDYSVHLRQHAEENLLSVVQLKVDEIARWRSERLGDARIMMESPYFVEHVAACVAEENTRSESEVLNRFNSRIQSYKYSSVLLVTPDGEIRAGTEGAHGKLEESGLSALSEAFAEHDAVFSRIHSRLGTSDRFIDTVAPFFDSSTGAPLAAIVLRMNTATFLDPFIEQWPSSAQTAETLLVRRDGEEITFLNNLRFREDAALTLRVPSTREELPAVMAAVQGKEGIVEGRDYRGKRVIAAAKQVPGSNWYVIAKINRSEALETGRTTSTLSLLLVGAIVLAIIGLVLALWQGSMKRGYAAQLAVEAERSQAQSRFVTILQSVGDGVIATDSQGRVEFLNPVAGRMMGWTEKEAAGRLLAEVFPLFDEESGKSIDTPVDKVLELGVAVELANHAVLIARDGRRIPIADSAAPIRDSEGNLQGVVLVFRDQTRERMTRRVLQESESRLKTLIYTIPDLVWLKDNYGTYLACNRAFERFFGAPADRIIGRTDYDFIDRELADFFRQKDLEAANSGGPCVNEEWVTIADDGHRALLETIKTPLFDADGKVTGVLGVAREVTAVRAAQDMLRRSEEKYRCYIDEAPVAVFVVSPEGRILDANPAAARVTGSSKEALLQLEFDAILDHTSGLSWMGLSIQDAVGVVSVESRLRRSDSDSIDVILSAVKLTEEKVLVFCQDVTEHRRTSRELVVMQQRAKDIFERMPAGLFVYRYETEPEQLILEEANPMAEKWTGVRISERRGHSFDEIWPAAREAGITETFLGVMRTGNSLTSESIDYRDEQIHTVSRVNLFPLPDNRLAVSFEDITEHARIEEQSRRWERLFEATKFGLVHADAATNTFVEVNPAFARDRGYTQEELRGAKITSIHPPEDFERIRQLIEQADRKGHLVFEATHMRKDGSRFPVLLDLTTSKDADGKPESRICYAQDISDKRHTEEELRRGMERLHLALDAANAGTWEWDLETNENVWSEELWKLYGLDASKHEPSYDTWRSILHPEDREMAERTVSEAAATGQTIGFEFRRVTPDGTTRWLLSRGNPILDAERKPIRYIGIAMDVTERRRLEAEQEKIQEQLLQAQKMESVGRLAGGVAHDFNNMLQSILGFSDLALSEIPAEQSSYGFLLEIRRAAERSAALTRQLLAFARKQTVTPKIIDLNEYIPGTLKMLRRLIGEDITINWQPGPGLRCVNIDPSQLDQVLANLTVNARDAIPGTGTITLSTSNAVIDGDYCEQHPGSSPGEYVMLCFGDSGEGMSRDVMEHLFEPFFTTKPLGKGTGLGLATVYGIVRQNDGFINVYSEPGLGTTFRIYLPGVGKADEETAAPLRKRELLRGDETILLVEDEAAILKLGRKMLEALGYTVLTASIPQEAIQLASTYDPPIDLLITDVVMPEMNGRDLSEEVSALKPGVRCLFMSGYTADVIAHQGIIQEGVFFLEKPFTMSGLAEMVRRVLDARNQ